MGSKWSWGMQCESDDRLNSDIKQSNGGRFAAIDACQLFVKGALKHELYQIHTDVCAEMSKALGLDIMDFTASDSDEELFLYGIYSERYDELFQKLIPDDLYAILITDEDKTIILNMKECALK